MARLQHSKFKQLQQCSKHMAVYAWHSPWLTGSRIVMQCCNAEAWPNEAYQVRVVLLMVLPELCCYWYNYGAVGSNCKNLVPEWFLERQKVTDLMLR